ncbi:helix-turn-helix transcriptional regulator [Longispora sp. K20-0274]|uniref:helix-turn-helix domain-containing protein n=1 Tax=Longispora sp. K20-0274 TaxID=3088255 RepID=UPI00399C4991
MSKSTDLFRRRQELGVALRELREDTGLSGARLAARLGVSQSKISKIETGLSRPSVDLVEGMLDALGASDATRIRIRELGGITPVSFTPNSVARQRGLDHKQRTVSAWEHESLEIRNFIPTMIPGLLQTSTYVRALFTAPEWRDRLDAERMIAARSARQEILYEDGRQFRFLLTEAGLRMRMCSSMAMASQLEHVATISKLPGVDVAILPWHVQLPCLVLNPFALYDERWLMVEHSHGEFKVRNRRDIEFYIAQFESMHQVALRGEEAREFLQKVADEHRGLPE